MNETFKEKLKKFSKKISIFTTNPEVDWERVFFGLVTCMIVGVLLSVLFFFDAEKSIVSTGDSSSPQSVEGANQSKDQQINKILNNFDIRSKKNAGYLNGTVRSQPNLASSTATK